MDVKKCPSIKIWKYSLHKQYNKELKSDFIYTLKKV